MEDFNKELFIAAVDNTYIMLLSAIMMGDINKVRHKLDQNLYNKTLEKVNTLNENNQIQMYDELNVASTTIVRNYEDEDAYYIEVSLISKYMDYRIDKTTKEYIDGINDHRITKNNYLLFRKYKDAKDSSIIKRCPSCGASIDINASGVCGYCRGIYDMENHGWVLVELR